MAPPRPGWSRRAQYGLFFSFLAVIAGIAVGLFLLALSLVAPKTFQSVRGAALDATAPVTMALHEVSATTEGLVSGAGDYWDAAHQNAKLTAKQVATIRERHAAGGVSFVALGREYGVSGVLIRMIVRRKIWKSVPPADRAAA